MSSTATKSNKAKDGEKDLIEQAASGTDPTVAAQKCQEFLARQESLTSEECHELGPIYDEEPELNPIVVPAPLGAGAGVHAINRNDKERQIAEARLLVRTQAKATACNNLTKACSYDFTKWYKI